MSASSERAPVGSHPESTHVTGFEHRDPEASRVELFGETSDWLNGIQLDASGHAYVPLPVGVYQYKFRLTYPDGTTRWALDPSHTRTRSDRGLQNSVVAVGGAPEPWLFAPAVPWVEELDRGGIRVLVGVRGGDLDAIEWKESEARGWSRAPTTFAFAEDEHRFFEAVLPVSAPSIRLRLGTFEAHWSRAPATHRLPEWWKRARLYTIFVDRFRPEHDRADWSQDPGRGVTWGGHLAGIRRSLDELSKLGINTLYLTPVHVAASGHRYDLIDPMLVDPALGGEAAYAALVDAARLHGMDIVQDVSFAHAGRGFAPWEDVQKHGMASRFVHWFVWKEGELVHYGKRTDAPLLDMTHPEVQDLAVEAVARWAKRGVRGLRLDMTAEVPLELGRKIRRKFRDLVPDGVVFGEVVPQHAWRWRAEGVIDAATDFGFHEILTELVCAPIRPDDAFARLARSDLLRGGDARTQSVRFLSTHDHARLATLATSRGMTARLPLAYVLLLTLPGTPTLLYGEEFGLRAARVAVEPEDVWPDRMPMPWDGTRDPTLLQTVRALLEARRDSEALRSGTLLLLHADADTLVFRRQADGEVIDVALNFGDEAKTVELEDDEHPAMTAVASIGGARVIGQSIALPAYGCLLARRERINAFAGRRNLVLRDRDLAGGVEVAAARPSRFLFSVTERCNLRCAHCITHAPERTRDGTARTMTPAVLDALAADLALADYFAFVHGGESLTAPIFFDILERIRACRGEEPYVVHLLTNGVKLDSQTVARLIASGVSSISISLDGATAATNDAIREGARFVDVCENVRRLVVTRPSTLRVGISFVVLAQNVAELSAIVALAADLGVDWLKLEEGVPATDFAKRSLVACSTAEVRRAVDAAVTLGRAHGLVMVNHTVPRTVWRCALDVETGSFLEADEFANYATMHPCRTPWETACIEPNGDVRCGDFYSPILGNVAATPLVELWNAGEARQLRRAMTLSRRCLAGPVVCVDP